MGGKLGFVAGALFGAAGAAAYFLMRGGDSASTGGFAQQRTQEAAGAFGGAAASAPAHQSDAGVAALAGQRNAEVEALSAQLSAQTGWQARMPALVSLGKQLATMPAAKQLAADRAVAQQQLPQLSPAPQDLALVNGIGSTYEQRLYAAGIGSFWELANLSDADFAELLELTELQRAAFDGEAVRAQAHQFAIDTVTVGRLWDGVAPDDLEPIKGIGKVFEQRLYDAGIRTYERLAAATPEELASVCAGHMPVKPDFASWIAQARELAAQRNQA